jgi:NADPH2:quinone reductase
MKAVWYDRQGPAGEVLKFGDMPTPQAGPGEIRIKLEASGVNPSDTYRRAGTIDPMEYPRVIVNSDGAGVVDQIGPGASRFRVGARVWLYNGQRNGRAFGTAAEYIALDENLVTPLPDNVSFVEGATLGVPGMTAWVCLFHAGRIDGQMVLVTGGAGAVGHYAVQLAKWGGARVITTVSSAQKAEIARAAGADLVVDYKREDVAERVRKFSPHGVDRIVEVDFGGNISATEKILARFSTVAVYATKGNPRPEVTVRALSSKNVTLYFMQLPLTPMPLQRKA